MTTKNFPRISAAPSPTLNSKKPKEKNERIWEVFIFIFFFVRFFIQLSLSPISFIRVRDARQLKDNKWSTKWWYKSDEGKRGKLGLIQNVGGEAFDC